MAYVEAEQMHLEVAEPVEVGLNASDTVDIVASNVLAAIVTSQEVANAQGKLSENGVNLEKIGDILKFDDMASYVEGTANGYHEKLPRSSERQVETGESSKNDGEVLEEEIVELEFEKVKPKLDTHSMHCPNCKAEVTKVILRRKVINYRPIVKQPVEPVEQQISEPKDLVGCFSCLSLFTFSDNGCFNPFDIFRKSPETTTVSPPPANGYENAKLVVRDKENCLSMFWVFGKGQNDPKPEDPQQPDPVYDDQEYITSDQVQPPRYVTGTTSNSIAKGSLPSSSNTTRDFNTDTTLETTTDVNSGGVKKGPLGFSPTPSPDLPPSSNVIGDGEFTIEVDTEPVTGDVYAPDTGRSLLGLEILKSIVYGGLMEVIASLSVVASAAASEATTLNIVALSFASLIGGILIIGHNLWDLKDDCKKESSAEEANKEATNKYKELLGRVNYFPLHAFFAILSFLVFGMVPPAAYGYSFHKTNDKDYTVVVVAIASLLCVTLLATFKAYISKCTVIGYFKTVVYYITTAVSVSGVSYVAGKLATRLLEELGLFDTSSSGGVSFFPASTPSLASF